ncbi:MAG: hypothetical protein M1451_01980 [Acidobacteria bacterium]|nr:hypothetical protein [Acidobacteriota bacterium]
MNLRETVDKYLEIAGDFDRAVPLEDFGLSQEETERHFSALDEDYHISRYVHFSDPSSAAADSGQASEQKTKTSKAATATFQINGFANTHVSIDAEIAEVL